YDPELVLVSAGYHSSFVCPVGGSYLNTLSESIGHTFSALLDDPMKPINPSVQPFVVKVTKNSIRDNVVAGNIQRKECTLFRCSFSELLTSKRLSLNIYRQDRPRRKKRKLVEILCAENSILYQKYNIE
ncbi:unnamed protein product, partial [Schistosoma intercalatum]